MRRILSLLLCLFLAISFMGAEVYDGTGDNHIVENLNSPPSGGDWNFTICMWIKSVTWQDGAAVVGYGNGTDSSAGRGWMLRTKDTGALRMEFYSGSTVYFEDSPTMSANAWHHLCFVRHSLFGNSWYIDDTDATPEANVAIDPGTSPNSTDDMYIAQPIPARTGAGYVNFNGQLEHVGYWIDNLTGAEVLSMADKSTCPTAVDSGDLEAFIYLSDGQSPIIDSSSNGFTVTEGGNPTQNSGPGSLPCGAGTTTTTTTSTTTTTIPAIIRAGDY